MVSPVDSMLSVHITFIGKGQTIIACWAIVLVDTVGLLLFTFNTPSEKCDFIYFCCSAAGESDSGKETTTKIPIRNLSISNELWIRTNCEFIVIVRFTFIGRELASDTKRSRFHQFNCKLPNCLPASVPRLLKWPLGFYCIKCSSASEHIA